MRQKYKYPKVLDFIKAQPQNPPHPQIVSHSINNGPNSQTQIRVSSSPSHILPNLFNYIKINRRSSSSSSMAASIPRNLVHEQQRNPSESGPLVRLAQRPQLQHNPEPARQAHV